jgi:DNA topoisomerase-3
MEGAGKLVEDEELREAMSAKGLGTPSTRAAIIEGLITEQYIIRQGRDLIPTAKAFSLIVLLRGIGIPELCLPELTGNWEFKLKQIEQGSLDRSQFMQGIAEMTRDIVSKAKGYEHDTVPGDFGILVTPCPKCGGEIHENYRKFQCQKCDFSLWKTIAARQFEPKEMDELLSKGVLGPLQGFRSKQGRPFAAILKLTSEFKLEFDFGQNGSSNDKEAEAVDFSGQQPLGTCPACGASVYENGMNYTCEKAVSVPRTCQFRTGKVILQRNIEREQVIKLLQNKKTDLLHKFISKKGRPFSAYLVINKDGKTGFEFEPRVSKGAKTGAKSAKKSSVKSAPEETTPKAEV